LLIVSGEKVKVCREQKIFTPNTENTDKLFLISPKTVRIEDIIYKFLGKNKVCQAQKFLYQTN